MEQGLRETSAFGRFHPGATTAYYAMVIGLTMFTTHPLLLGISAITAFCYSLLLRGLAKLRGMLLLAVLLPTMTTLLNGLFTHNGATVLFYLRGNRITVEAFVYGAVMGLMILAVLWWFTCFSVTMTSDKLIYVFGRLTPVLGLTLSMIFRFVPLLKQRYREIAAGQQAMGCGKNKGLVARTRQLTKEISILISWSLEASIESADSMTARGYGLRGRTSFHLFRFTAADGLLVAMVLLLGAGCICGYALGMGTVYFYPVWNLRWQGGTVLALGAALAVLCLLPMLMDVYGERKWKKYASTM